MRKRIAVTGYFGVGSSAVFDLLSEYSCNTTGLDKDQAYEHTIFYTPNGLFDLEDKLLLANDIHRSDEALRSFENEMKNLNNNNYGWFGSLKHLFGNGFSEITSQFIKCLSVFEIPSRYYGQYKGVRFSIMKLFLQAGARLLQNRKIYKWGRQYIYSPKKASMNVCFPTPGEFYKAAQKYVSDYLDLFGKDLNKNVIYDRLLLCHNVYRLPRYFDENFRIIIIERDIRDLYILNKYIWPSIHAQGMFPRSIDEFINYWKRLKACEGMIEDSRILHIKFENLIYNYDDTVRRIEEFCELEEKDHDMPKKYFKPEKSIKNTQVFRMDKTWKKEIEILEKEFKDSLFEFPFVSNTDISNMFDDSRI